jgi:hypothetical protein
MNYVFYAKVKGCCGGDNYTDEIFTVANNFTEAANQIEDRYGTELLGFSLYCFDSDVIHVQDIEEYLKEARETVG